VIKSIVKNVVPSPLWTRICGTRWQIDRALRRWGKLARIVGAISAMITYGHSLRGSPSKHSDQNIRLRCLNFKGYDYPIFYRTQTSDLDVILQVFVDEQYDCVGEENSVKLIIDCGANIGCTSFYLLHRYPNAHVVAVEPDPQNFALCQRNLAPFAERVTLVNSGVWPEPVPLQIERGTYADGREWGEWAIQVRPAQIGERPDMIAVTIDGLINQSGLDGVDILKIDIEGAEAALFSEGVEKWLSRTRHLAIEIHGTKCEQIFDKIMSQYSWIGAQHGELRLCKNITTRPLVLS
jgi:FkbM family methyltransferase